MAQLKGKLFQVILTKDEQRDSLEFKKHANTAAEYLSRKGMYDADGSNEKPDFIVTLDYSVTGENRLKISSTPTFTTTSTSIYSPATVQYAGSSVHSRNTMEYTHLLHIRIHNAEAWSKGSKLPVFEAEAYSMSPSRDTTVIVPQLINALLFDFPAPSGTSSRVSRQSTEQ